MFGQFLSYWPFVCMVSDFVFLWVFFLCVNICIYMNIVFCVFLIPFCHFCFVLFNSALFDFFSYLFSEEKERRYGVGWEARQGGYQGDKEGKIVIKIHCIKFQ